jgi:hypothetical protein
MALQEFAFDAAGTRRIQVSRQVDQNGDGGFLTILLDGSMIGNVSEQEACRTGRELLGADGSVLKVQVVKDQVQVLKNGLPLLPVSAATTQSLKPSIPSKLLNQFRSACGVIFFIGGLNVILGLVLAQSPTALPVPAPAVFIEGSIYLLLGFFVARRSTVALGIAVTLYALDGIASLSQGNMSGILLRVFILTVMIRGFSAIQAIRNAERVA